MKSAFLASLALLLSTAAQAQYCDFLGKDSLFVTVQQDTIYLWDMAACAQCAAEFSDSVSLSHDTVYVVQTDTAGRIATCDCLFNLRVSITGLARGSYRIALYRDLLKKYGYYTEEHKFIGALQFQYEPSLSPGLSWNSYQSGCITSYAREEPRQIPSGFALLGVYPNPFNPTTTVQFRTSRTEFVVLRVYDVLGREVQTIHAARVEPGSHTVTFRMPWDLKSGVYYCRMTAGSFSQTKPIVLIH